ncbi:lasso peptide biosynthesis B2 protein [Jeotgalibacillus sp. ET6]|uniref:lasso peptide biosynthesis B2 protein n=1 Tax=Jeotgalibacillus sp. ET6 TaxID=3037260 RepID=UPI0024188AB2|nr:lasso peptide biosynthesis B2 protein [Jeotgalibacillus sp. ET6]MDG5472622.1 lasso peptide biosynthesis B2 protein [Jeotgalibacillus sp. ET6]
MNKVKAFFSLNKEVKGLLIETYVHLAKARIAKIKPFSEIAPTLGEHMKETSFEPEPESKRVLASVSQSVNLMSKYTFWESQCLVKAIAAMRMLEKRKIESTLYLGTGRDEHGKLAAHAWLRSGPYYITGSEGMDKYTVVGKFAKRIPVKRQENEDEPDI